VSDCLASILFKEEGSDFSKIRFHELSVKSIIDERLQDEKNHCRGITFSFFFEEKAIMMIS